MTGRATAIKHGSRYGSPWVFRERSELLHRAESLGGLFPTKYVFNFLS